MYVKSVFKFFMLLKIKYEIQQQDNKKGGERMAR